MARRKSESKASKAAPSGDGRSKHSAFDRAIEHKNAWRLDEAVELLEQIVARDGLHFEAQFHLGALRFQQGHLDKALAHFECAKRTRPREPSVWANIAIVLMRLGRRQEAVSCCDEALALKPSCPQTLSVRGNALRALGRLAEAAACYQAALELSPNHVVALGNYGCLLMELRRLDEALTAFDKALAIADDNPAMWGNRAAVLIDLQRPRAALINADKALALEPDNISAINNRGAALKLLKRPREALLAYESALALDRDCIDVWRNRGDALADLGRTDDALASFDQAIAINPNDSASYEHKGVVLAELGHFLEAGQALRQAIAIDPNKASAYYNLVQIEHLSLHDPELETMLALDLKIDTFDTAQQIFLHYALAEVFECNGEKEVAFQRQCAGAALKRGVVYYDEAATIGEFVRIQEIFDAPLIAWLSQFRGEEAAPIFIVSMPRSGSTLLEQVIASHSGVVGLGEIDAFSKALSEFDGPARGAPCFPDAATALTPTELSGIAAAYIRRIRAFAAEDVVTVDKTLDNFRFLGLIHAVFPKARIIHIARDPIETCLSCFAKCFNEGLGFSYDLGELGRYYRSYEKLMSHWRNVLPKGVLLDVRYEDFIADLPGQSRLVSAFCGLEWSERCLEFHRVQRQVRTASNVQVRQPLFDGSARRRDALGRHLSPLKAALGLT